MAKPPMALVCIDTATRRMRRYIPQVHAGVRRAYSTHEYFIIPPQVSGIEKEINRVRELQFVNAMIPPAAA